MNQHSGIPEEPEEPEEPEIDLSQFRQPSEVCPKPSKQKNSRVSVIRHCDGEFLKGPIPLKWLSRACQFDGKVLHTALAIWFEAGRRQPQTTLKLTSKILNRFHVGRKAKYAALVTLQHAGLVMVTSKTGKNPVVTILDAPPDER